MNEKLTMLRLAERVPDEAAAYEYLEELRWEGRPVCPHCGSVRPPYFLKPRNGARKTSTGRATQRRLWKCADCRQQFSVLTGTVMHGTKIPVRTWVFVLYEICASKNGIAAREIERRYGIAGRSAWFMVHRIREAMKVNGLAGLFSGTVVADETFIGPNPRNFHKGRRFQADHAKRAHKVAVLSLVHRESGEVRSQVVANVRGLTLRAAIESQVDLPQTVLHTDSAESYVKIGWKAAGHESVNHGMSEYVRDGVSTNMAEGYFSQLKRSLDGTHHHVSREHLPRYLAEFDFRYSTCHDTDTERMLNLVGRVGGRRLAYRTVTADRQPVAAAS